MKSKPPGFLFIYAVLVTTYKNVILSLFVVIATKIDKALAEDHIMLSIGTVLFSTDYILLSFSNIIFQHVIRNSLRKFMKLYPKKMRSTTL